MYLNAYSNIIIFKVKLHSQGYKRLIVLMGVGLRSDNLHSPNEKFDLANFYKGIETIPYFHKYFEG
jgi:acetylornithine deacetylase/succinyl-diaminopimelate desuccinylase-like protein